MAVPPPSHPLNHHIKLDLFSGLSKKIHEKRGRTNRRGKGREEQHLESIWNSLQLHICLFEGTMAQFCVAPAIGRICNLFNMLYQKMTIWRVYEW